MSADLIRRMVEAGTPADIIADVAMALASAEASTAALSSRRASDRDRKAAERDRVRGSHVTSAEAAEIPVQKVSEVPPNDILLTPLLPSKITNTPRRAKADFHRLPDDWQPGPLPASLAVHENEWPPGFLDTQADRFRDWAANAADENGKGRKLKWDQAFHNWLRDNSSGKRPANTPVQRNGFNRPANGGDSFHAAVAAELADVGEQRRAAADRDRTGRDPGQSFGSAGLRSVTSYAC